MNEEPVVICSVIHKMCIETECIHATSHKKSIGCAAGRCKAIMQEVYCREALPEELLEL